MNDSCGRRVSPYVNGATSLPPSSFLLPFLRVADDAMRLFRFTVTLRPPPTTMRVADLYVCLVSALVSCICVCVCHYYNS